MLEPTHRSLSSTSSQLVALHSPAASHHSSHCYLCKYRQTEDIDLSVSLVKSEALDMLFSTLLFPTFFCPREFSIADLRDLHFFVLLCFYSNWVFYCEHESLFTNQSPADGHVSYFQLLLVSTGMNE